MKVEIFGFPEDVIRCPNCMKCKNFCEENNLEYVFHRVVTGIERGKFVRDIDVCNDLMDRMNLKNADKILVPKVFIDGAFVGGFQDLKNSVNKFTRS